MTELLIKALAGALIVILIDYLANTDQFYVAGLVPLFPTFALITHIVIGSTRSSVDLRETALFGIFSVVPYLAYLLCVFLLVDRFKLVSVLSLAVFAWCGFSGALLFIWHKYIHA